MQAMRNRCRCRTSEEGNRLRVEALQPLGDRHDGDGFRHITKLEALRKHTVDVGFGLFVCFYLEMGSKVSYLEMSLGGTYNEKVP